jgi:hypothetical protein
MSLQVYTPLPPPTLNALDCAQKARLIRSTRKLGAVLGTTPYFFEEQQVATRQLLPIRPSVSPPRSNSQRQAQPTTISQPTHRRSVSYPSPEASFLDFSTSSRSSTATKDEPPALSRPPSPKKLKAKGKPKPHALDLRISPSSSRPCLHLPDSASSWPRPTSPTASLTYRNRSLAPHIPSFSAFPEPVIPVVTKAELKKRRAQKLARYLGENVPPELVLLEAPGNDTKEPSSPTHSNAGEYFNPDYRPMSADWENREPSPTPSKPMSFISRIPKQRPVIPIFILPVQQQQHCLPVLTPASRMATPIPPSSPPRLRNNSVTEKDRHSNTTISVAETPPSPSQCTMSEPEDNIHTQVPLSPLSIPTPTFKSKSFEELSVEVNVTVREDVQEKVEDDAEEKSGESDSDDQEEIMSHEETKTNIPVSNLSVDPIFVVLNTESSEGEGEAEAKMESPKVDIILEEQANTTTDTDKPATSERQKPTHHNHDSYSDTHSHGALSLHLHLHHRTTAHARRRRRSASLSSVCPLPIPTRRASLHRPESFINVSAFVPLRKRKKRTNIVNVAAPHACQPSDLPFSNTVAKNGDEESSAEGGEESVEGAGMELETGEKVGKGWSAPNPDGRLQSWEGEWNLSDVKEVQRMLRLLR